MNIPTSKEYIRNALITQIEYLLDFCSEKERDFFHQIHKSAPWKTFSNCPDDQLPGYYDLVRRTLLKDELYINPPF